MDNVKWKKFLDSSGYIASHSSSVDRGKREIEKALSNIPDDFKDKHILLLGCGDGFEVEILKKRGFQHLIGVTYDSKEIERAKENDRNVIFCDMHELPFANDSFDLVYSKETLEHSFAPYIALNELNRVTKIGGRFLHYIAEGIDKQGDWYHFSCFPPFVWIDLFHLNRFKVEKVLTFERTGKRPLAQSVYYGCKVEDKNLEKTISHYNLRDLIKDIRFGELDLLCDAE